MTAEQRFWSRISKQPNGCWFWTGTPMNSGYGQISVDGRHRLAHRFAYELHNGPIPKGLFVCHRCANPPCCNPNHLFLGTPKQNTLHCIAQGRKPPMNRPLPKRNWRRFFIPVQARGRTAKQRFWNCVEKTPNGCWLWVRGKTAAGYGSFALNGKRVLAHRYSWELSRGKIKDGQFVLHNCPSGDNPSCVNPAHLLLGTPMENARDAVRKGRFGPQAQTLKRLWSERGHEMRGESNPRSKLTDVKVREMRHLHATQGWGYNRLRKHFGVSFGVVQRIINRKAWNHI